MKKKVFGIKTILWFCFFIVASIGCNQKNITRDAASSVAGLPIEVKEWLDGKTVADFWFLMEYLDQAEIDVVHQAMILVELERWPSELRVLPDSWVSRAIDGEYIGPIKYARVLNLDGKLEDIGTLEKLFNSSETEYLFEHLRVFDISNNHLGPRLGNVIGESPRSKNIERLDLSRNAIGDEGIGGLFRNSYLTGISTLNVSRNGITADGISHVFEVNPGWDGWAGLQYLDIGFNPVGFSGVVAFAAKAEELTGLRGLTLDGIWLPAELIEHLAESDVLKKLIELSLNSCRIDDEGAEILSKTEGLANLSRLSLNDNQFSEKAMVHLGNARFAPNLLVLRLQKNLLNETFLDILASANYPKLASLDLFGNEIGDRAIEVLPDANCCQSLKRLNLGLTALTIDGYRAIQQFEFYDQIEALDISYNEFGAGFVKELDVLTGLTCLNSLNLSGNDLGGFELEVNDAKNFSKLNELVLRDNGLRDFEVEYLFETFGFPELSRLDLSRNRLTYSVVSVLLGRTELGELKTIDLRMNITPVNQKEIYTMGNGILVFL